MNKIDRRVIEIVDASIQQYPDTWYWENGYLKNDKLGFKISMNSQRPGYSNCWFYGKDSNYVKDHGEFIGTFFGWIVPWRRRLIKFARNKQNPKIDSFLRELEMEWKRLQNDPRALKNS